MTWSSEAKLRNNNAELSLRYSGGRASEAVSQSDFLLGSRNLQVAFSTEKLRSDRSERLPQTGL